MAESWRSEHSLDGVLEDKKESDRQRGGRKDGQAGGEAFGSRV